MFLFLLFKLKFVLSALAAREALAIKCIQCTGEIDHDGNVLGGDAGCFDGDNVEKYSIECPESKPVCGVELVADWFPRGFQHYKIRRECRTKVFYASHRLRVIAFIIGLIDQIMGHIDFTLRTILTLGS